MEPDLSVLIASDRVRTLLPECLRSLQREVQRGGPAIEVVVCSAEPPATDGLSIPIRWARADAGNPARRRNAAAREARGRLFAFLDDDATAEPGWLASGAAALEKADIAGGPDPGPGDAPPLTGGKRATSSPSDTTACRSAYSSFTDVSIIDR